MTDSRADTARTCPIPAVASRCTDYFEFDFVWGLPAERRACSGTSAPTIDNQRTFRGQHT